MLSHLAYGSASCLVRPSSLFCLVCLILIASFALASSVTGGLLVQGCLFSSLFGLSGRFNLLWLLELPNLVLPIRQKLVARISGALNARGQRGADSLAV